MYPTPADTLELRPEMEARIVVVTKPTDLLSTKEAAKIIGVKVRQVQSLCKKHGVKQVGGTYVITRAEAERLRDIERPMGRPRNRN